MDSDVGDAGVGVIDPHINPAGFSQALQNWGGSTGYEDAISQTFDPGSSRGSLTGSGLGYFVTPGAILQGFQGPGQWSNPSLGLSGFYKGGMGSSDLNALTGLNLASNYDFPTTSVGDYEGFVGFPPETGIFGGTLGPRMRKAAGKIVNVVKKYGKDFAKNLARFANPYTAAGMMVWDAFEAFKEGGAEGIKNAIGQTAMRRMFGKNLDVAGGIYGAISGDMTPGQALGRVALSRGMKMGINNLMKNIYGQWGMDGVRLAMPMIQTALQGKGKGPGGP